MKRKSILFNLPLIFALMGFVVFLPACEKDEVLTDVDLNKLFNPVPPDNAVDQELNLELTWTCPFEEVACYSYEISLGESTSQLDKESKYSETHQPYNLEYDKTYFWKVVAYDWDNDSIVGPVWRFTTIPDPCAPYWPVCNNETGLDQVTAYPGTGQIHPIAICGSDIEIPENWQPNHPEDLELIACISREQSSIQVCNYTNGGRHTRYRQLCSILLHSAKTGEVIASTSIYGGTPPPCPNSISGLTSWRYGPSVTDAEITAWLEDYVVD